MKIVFFAPKGFGYSTNQFSEGMHLLSQSGVVEFYCTDKVVHHGSKTDDLQTVSEDEAWRHVPSADMCVIASDGDEGFTRGFSGRCLSDASVQKKLVFLDGSDRADLICDPTKLAMYLKRECRSENHATWSVYNVRPHPFGIYDFHFDSPRAGWAHRRTDVAFAAFGGSSPTRQQLGTWIKAFCSENGLTYEIHVSNDDQPLSIEQYREVMERAKVGISTWGAGLDTLRFWETIGFGAVVVSADLDKLVIPHKPLQLQHAIYCNSAEVMGHRIMALCKNEAVWSRIRNNAADLASRSHSTVARAMQVIEQFKEFA